MDKVPDSMMVMYRRWVRREERYGVENGADDDSEDDDDGNEVADEE
jgi:hypothetical protein